MRHFVLFIALIFTTNIYCQIGITDKNRYDITPYPSTLLNILAGLSSTNNGDYLTPFSYCDLQLVQERLFAYFQDRLGMYSDFDKCTFKNNIFTQYLIKSGVYINEPKKYLWIKYHVFDNSLKNKIVKYVEIYGDWNSLLDFYVSYWPTTININVDKNKISNTSFWQDKCELKYDINKKQGYLIIKNGTIKDEVEYESIINHNKSIIQDQIKADHPVQKKINTQVSTTPAAVQEKNNTQVYIPITTGKENNKYLSGKNDNSYNIIPDINKIISSNFKPNINSPFMCSFMFKINDSGFITDVTCLDQSCDKGIVNKIISITRSMSVQPFIGDDSKSYNSFAKLNIDIWTKIKVYVN